MDSTGFLIGYPLAAATLTTPLLPIKQRPQNLLAGLSNYAVLVNGVSSFDERMFLGPLASLINDRSCFENGNVVAVSFKTDPGLSYGKVLVLLAVLVLAIPVLCTIALSVITTTQRRWTASLDAFSMFKLGTDWRSNLENQKLVSLGKVSSHVKVIPGTVVVNLATGVVELAHAPKTRRLSRNSRRPGWLQDYAASAAQNQGAIDVLHLIFLNSHMHAATTGMCIKTLVSR